MSYPRPVLPNRTYLLTRRCSQRMFFLRPSPLLNQIFLFCLALAARRYAIEVHAVCVMSNHYHIVATDTRGQLPDFMRWLNEFVAKSVNQLLGRSEPLWAPPPYSAVLLVRAEDVFEKMLYTFNNPVTAELVSTGEQWPGLRSRPEDLNGPPRPVSRPKIFFRNQSHLPENLSLQLVPPPQFDDIPLADLISALRERIRQKHESVRETMRCAGRTFPRAREVLAQSPFDAPRSPAKRRKIDPRIACKDRSLRLETIRQLKSFLIRYREAWHRFRAGDRKAVFPPGTFLMRTRFAVECAASP